MSQSLACSSSTTTQLGAAGSRSSFSDLGHGAIAVASAEEAIATAAAVRVRAIILDLGLPGMSGMAALRELQKHSDAPVIVLTAFADEVIASAAERRGAKAVIAKENVTETLPDVLARAIAPSA